MKRLSVCHILCASVFVFVLTAVSPLAYADQWTAPTAEELAMTSQPEVPGAAAVYLFREETTEDKLHMFSTYVRLKVLTEEGKKYANVELGYASSENGGSITIDEIQGRTIHPDGTIIPFTGKPYDKLIQKSRDAKYMEKVFTLPDVEVGSIIEYRYKRRLDDNYFMAPQWYVQYDLYTRKAHYIWKPTNARLVTNNGRGQLTSSISWTPILPEGADFKNTRLPPQGMDEGQLIFELNIHDVPPVPDEDFMPPIRSLSYRVLFYYSPYRSKEEFWKGEGKSWAKYHDKFIGPGSGIRAAVQSLTTPSDTQDQKLHKIYDAVMQLENTDFTREHTTAEEKAAGLKQIRTTDDVWSHKRGSSDQLSDLFVAMARAAGMKAYVMVVTNRDHNIFLPSYLSLSQLDDDIAIVNVDGKEQFFDPGSRFCTYGHLAWKHTAAAGLREVEGGTALFNTPPDSYTASRIQRVADLTMDEHGIATGIVTMVYSGAPALSWRQRSLTGDNTSLERDLRTNMEELLPSGMEVKLVSVSNPNTYQEPLRVTFAVKGAIGSSTGKRLIVPSDIFEANSKPVFPHEKRDIAVYFNYPNLEQDAVRVKFPASMTVESTPSNDKISFQHYAAYDMSIASTPTSITVHRDYALGEFIFLPKDYTELRSFYSKMDTKNQESIVLTASTVSTAKSGAAN